MNIKIGRQDLNWRRLQSGGDHEKTEHKRCIILSGAQSPFICGLHPKIRFRFCPSMCTRFPVVEQILSMEVCSERKGKFKRCLHWPLKTYLTQYVLGSSFVLMAVAVSRLKAQSSSKGQHKTLQTSFRWNFIYSFFSVFLKTMTSEDFVPLISLSHGGLFMNLQKIR